jgi:tetratricopeptide (TPR) repeat protein
MKRPTVLALLAALSPLMAAANEHLVHGTNGTVWTSRHAGLPHVTSTRSPEAQRFFDQGLLLVYAFNHAAAVEAFEQALQLDDSFALAHWGIALAHSANINSPLTAERLAQARVAISLASEKSAHASRREREYIEAMRLRYPTSEFGAREQVERDYAQAMKALAQRYPDDATAATLYADALMNLIPWQYWTSAGLPAAETPEIISALERALRIDPDHLGAHHYYIHAMEASPFPERALPSALRLEALGLDTGHLAHMPSHIYLRTGDFDAVVRANSLAVKADRDYLQAVGERGYSYFRYHAHNLEFLALGHTYRGEFDQALEVADAFNAAIDRIVATSPGAEQKYVARISVLLRFARWPDVLALSEPPDSQPIHRAFWRYARATAESALGRAKSAQHEHRAFVEARARIKSDAYIGQSLATDIFDIADRVARGRIAVAQGKSAEAVSLLREAVALQDALAYDEPPNWYYPVRETLGSVLLREGRAIEAEHVFREDLRRNPGNARSLFGLAESLKAQQRVDEAALVEARFRRAWAHSSKQLRLESLW